MFYMPPSILSVFAKERGQDPFHRTPGSQFTACEDGL